MATVGTTLTAPEEGWRRYDDEYANLNYSGPWIYQADSNHYNGSLKFSTAQNSAVQFNFTGSKIRIISYSSSAHSEFIEYILDGNLETISHKDLANEFQVLTYNKEDLEEKEHSLIISLNGSGYLALDAIDIDTNREIKPYNPSPAVEEGEALLCVTMIDSSEREYKVSKAVANDFVAWCNRTIGTGNSVYVFDKDIQDSKEYLFYEKIISFEVIPLA